MKTLIIIPSDPQGKVNEAIYRGIGSFSVLSYTTNTTTLNRGITATERGFIAHIADEYGVDVIILQVTDEQAENFDDRVMFIDLANNENL